MQSEDKIKKIVTLIGKQIRGELNAIDERELNIWISESESNKIMFDQLTDPAYRQAELMEMRSFTSAPSAFANFMEKYGERARVEDEVYIPPKPQIEENKNYESLKYTAVTIVLLTISIGFFIHLKNREELKSDIKFSSIIANGTQLDSTRVIGTTLLDVSRAVKSLDQEIALNASQEFLFNNHALKIFEHDSEESTLWKEGLFVFEGETLESLMRKITHWYDVDVVYEDSNIGKRLCSGSVSRFSSITSLLNKLEKTSSATFKIEGKRIFVQSRY